MVQAKLSVWLIEGVWTKWNIAPRHDPIVTYRRAIAKNWIRSWGGSQGRYGCCACRHPSGVSVTAPSERSRLGVVFHSLFIGGGIVHIHNGDESGVLRNWVALPCARVLKPNLTVVTATYRRTRSACCKTRVVTFCFLSRCVAMFCFHFASTDLAARC